MKRLHARFLVGLILLGSFGSVYAEYTRTSKVRLWVRGKVVDTAGNDYVRVTINGESNTYYFDSILWTTESVDGEFEVDLNENYSATVTAPGMEDYHLIFSPYFADGREDPIETVLNGSVIGSIEKDDISGTSFDFRIRYKKIKEPVIPFGKAAPIVGTSKMEVHLGLGRDTQPGYGAGKITLKSEKFADNDLSTTDAVFSTHGGTVIISSHGTRRQALAPEGLADVQDLTGGGFIIRYYEIGEFSATADSNGIYSTSGGTPFITYEVTDPDSTNDSTSGSTSYKYREFKIKRITSNKTDYLVYDAEEEYFVSSDYIGQDINEILNNWHTASGQSEVNYERDYSYEWSHYEDEPEVDSQTTTFKTYNALGTVVDIKEEEMSDQEGIRDESFKHGGVTVLDRLLDRYESDPYQKDIDRTRAETKYHRYTKSNKPAAEPEAVLGKLWKTRQTFLDSSNQLITTYKYWDDSSGLLALPSEIITKKGAQIVSKTTATYTEPSLFGESIIQKVETNYALDGESYQTTIKSYRPDESDDHLKGKTISIVRPDETKTSYLIQKGSSTWNETTDKYEFTADSTEEEIRVVTLHGKDSSSGADLVSSYDGADIDDLYMEEVLNGTNYGKNLAEEVWYDAQGRIHYKATRVYIGSGNFALLTHRKYQYNEYGYLEKEYEFITGPATEERVYYSATFADGQKTSETNAQGIVTEFSYDDYDRVEETIKKGVSVNNFDAQGDIETTYTRDAAGNILTETIHDPSESISQTYTYTYDTAGRVLTATDSADLTTSYTYTSDTVTTTTYPNGATKTVTQHKDGRLYTITGTAQPPVTYTYGFETSVSYGGALWTKEANGTGPWKEQYKDWLGRPAKNVSPTTTNAGDFLHEFHYDDTTGLLTKETFKSGSTTLAPSKLYQYDAYGRLLRTASNSDTNSDYYLDGKLIEKLDLSLDHNVIEYFGHFQKFSSDWYRFDGHGIYGTDDSSTLKVLRNHYQRVSPFDINTGSESTIAYSFTQDKFGNWTEDYVKLNRSEAKLITQHYVDKNPNTDQLMAETFNLNGLLVKETNAEGHDYEYHYDAVGRLELSEDGRGLETDYVYNSDGQLSYQEDAAGIRTTYLYDANTGLVTAEKNDSDKYTRYSYDAMGRVTHVWGDVPHPVKYAYEDPLGRLTRMDTYRTGTFTGATQPSAFDSAGDKTEWEYDSHSGLLEVKRDAKDKTNTFTYNKLGQVLTRTDGRGVTVTHSYYAAVNPATDGFPNGLEKVTYPSAGGYNDSTSSNYTPDLTYKYHRHGGLKSVQEGSVTTRTFTFDSNFELTQENLGAFNNNQTLNYTYDTTTTGFKGRLSAFNFVNDSTYKNSYTFDATSRLDQVTANHYSSTAFDYTYHTEANVVDYLQHGNYKIDPVYRSDSYRLDKVIHNWGSGASKQQETRFTYDNLGRRIEEKTRGYFTTYQGYSSNGHVTDTDYNDRNEVDYSARFLLNSSWEVLTTQVTGSYHEWTYDAIGNRLTRKVEQPTGTTVTENYQTNELNQYTSGPESFGLTLTYDDNGNITSDQIYNYTYDAENRVTRIVESWGWGQIDFKYDYLGRRTQKKAAKLVNGLRGHYYNNTDFTGFSHQQTDSQINFDWGAGGASGLNADTFLIRWTGYLEAPDTGNYTLTLNKDDGAKMWLDGKQIINAWTTTPASASASVHLKKGVRHHIVIDFWEDTGTAHVNLTWSGPGVTGTEVVPSANLWSHSITQTEETRYIYEGWNLIAETDGSHVIQRKFTWGLDVSGTMQGAGGVGGLLMIQDGTDEYFPIYDGSGNITGLYDENGNVDAAYEYDAYGRIVKQSGSYADENPFRFSTKYTDAETNLVYYGYRYYNPRLGRFLNRDPIGEYGGINLYGFVGNNPANFYDYLGLETEEEEEEEDELGFWERLGNSLMNIGSAAGDVVVGVIEGVEDIISGTLSGDPIGGFSEGFARIGRGFSDAYDSFTNSGGGNGEWTAEELSYPLVELTSYNVVADERTGKEYGFFDDGSYEAEKFYHEMAYYDEWFRQRRLDSFFQLPAGQAAIWKKHIDKASPIAVIERLATVAGVAGIAKSVIKAGVKALIKKAASKRGVGSNAFRGKTPKQIDKMLKKKGYEPRGSDPKGGRGGYVNPKSGRSYHIDPGKRRPPQKPEPPHVDVNRKTKWNPIPTQPKKKFPL